MLQDLVEHHEWNVECATEVMRNAEEEYVRAVDVHAGAKIMLADTKAALAEISQKTT